MAFDAEGDLYVSEFEGQRVVKIANNGALTVVAGTGSAGFSGDGGPAAKAELNAPTGVLVRSDGRLVVTNHHNNRIRVVSRSGVITTVTGSVAAGLDDPIGIALGKDGSVYVADELNARVARLDPSGKLDVGGWSLRPQ